MIIVLFKAGDFDLNYLNKTLPKVSWQSLICQLWNEKFERKMTHSEDLASLTKPFIFYVFVCLLHSLSQSPVSTPWKPVFGQVYLSKVACLWIFRGFPHRSTAKPHTGLTVVLCGASHVPHQELHRAQRSAQANTRFAQI